MATVFISYRRDDSAGHAGRLFDRLKQHLDDDSVVMDIEAIKPGQDFVDAVSETARSSDVVIVLIGRRWLTITDAAGRRRLDNPGDIVRLEIRTALERQDVHLIPVLVGGATMPDREELPGELETLARLNAVEISDSRFDHDVRRLIDTLREAMAASKRHTLPQSTGGGAGAKRSSESSPKYFIYVSDQKVDMLYAQISNTARRTLQAEFDQSSRSSESSGQEADRYSKLRVVAGYIDRTFDVGTVDDPRSYFRGVHDMRWGPYGHSEGAFMNKYELDAKIVYFGGSTEQTHFGLGGGLHHVIGNERGNTEVRFHSSTPYLVSVLVDELRMSGANDERWWHVHKWMTRIEHRSADEDEVKALIAVMNANSTRGPRQRLEFLAKTLLHRSIRTPIGDPNATEQLVLLGSPIYVALADTQVRAE